MIFVSCSNDDSASYMAAVVIIGKGLVLGKKGVCLLLDKDFLTGAED